MQTIDQVAVNTLRFLSIDEVEKAKSGLAFGHGAADVHGLGPFYEL